MYLQLKDLIIKKSELVSLRTIKETKRYTFLILTTKQGTEYTISDEEDILTLIKYFSSKVS